MTIREYAKKHDFNVIGKLTRHPEHEWDEDYTGFGERKWGGYKFYADEGGNEYYISGDYVLIVTAEECML